MKTTDLFCNASVEELKQGYTQVEDNFVCLFCGKKSEKGIVYSEDGVLYEAEKYMSIHICKEHQSVFDSLINLDKKLTGLSDHQNSLLRLFYEGKSDAEIQERMDIGSSSTIRNHRFMLKEKERQAKVFLVLMELLKDKDKRPSVYVAPHKEAKMVDDRYNVTQDESDKILKKYFPQGTNGHLKTFNMKEKSKLVVLKEIAKRFKANMVYTEKEVNEILKTAYDDFSTLRRYLIEYGFMDRKPDGSQYWVKDSLVVKGTEESKKEVLEEDTQKGIDRRKELKQEYKQIKTEAGVYQIRNTKNQKVLVVSTPNLKTINGRHIELQMGGHKNKQLQDEWKQYGEEAFVFEVLDVLKENEDGFFDKTGELKKLEAKWLEKLQPYGEKGYNNKKNIKK